MAEQPNRTDAANAESTQLEHVQPALETDTVSETFIEPDESVKQAAEQMAARSNELSGEFGRYQIRRLLGKGAMGAVYLADDSQLSRQVALKVPQFTARSPGNLIERFYREARSAATLTHPNICPVYDVGEINGRHFISMGYIEGRPLSDYIESGKKQPEKQVAGVIRKLALALQEAHDNGVVHRDLKPANIMIDRRNEPIVMDFGLAKQTDDRQEAKLTKDGTVMGSPAYMSPEQVGARSDLGPPNDIYSLGVVLYELLTGEMPFQGSVVSVIGQIIKSDPKSPAELRGDVSAEMESICLKAMAKSPQDRFASMAAFAQTLRAHIAGDSESLRANMNIDSKTEVTQVDLEKSKSEVSGFLESGQLRKAVSTLETLAEDPRVTSTEVGPWVQEALPQAKLKLEKAVEESKSLLRRAKRSMDGHDYDRAWQLLDQVPKDLANNAVSDLKVEAQELADEVDGLSIEIEDAMKTGHFDDMMPTVERMLELKPQHRQANDLYEKISTQTTQSEPVWKKRRSRGRKKAAKRSQIIGISAGGAVLLLGVAFALGWFDGDDRGQQSVSTGTSGASVEEGRAQDHDGQPPTGPMDRGPGEFGPPLSGDPVEARQKPGFPRQGKGRPPFRFEGRGESPEDAFKRADGNEDGFVDENEVPYYMIDRADSDDDGQVTYQEFLSAFGELGADFFRPPFNDRVPKLREGRFRKDEGLPEGPDR